jgi:rSAM/selenodomain-associated transferase 1
VHCVPQEGQDLGERLIRAFDRLFAAGHDRVAIIGSDSPHLPATHMNEAFELLASCDVVFGPSRDGGYYLVALNRPRPELFRDVPWSTDAVLARSLEIAAGADIRTALLPEWCDVDTVADLKRPELLAPDNGADLTRSFLVHRMGLCAEETDAGSARQDG